MAKDPASLIPVVNKRRGGRPPVDPNETPELRFKRLAGVRMSALLEQLRLLRQCFVTGNYEWTPEQGDKIIKALEGEAGKIVHAARNPSGPGGRSGSRFDL